MRVGLIVNPVAGIGGRVGLKGSDGAAVQERAFALGAVARAGERAAVALAELRARRPDLAVLTAAGAMGEDSARAAGLSPMVVFAPGDPTSAADTAAAARLLAPDIDLLLFAGGDGTARDVLEAVGDSVPVLGIPTGVKMHSAVFAVNPRAAGEVAATYSALRDAEVVDRVDSATRLFGYLRVPDIPTRVQQRKTGSSAVTPDAVSGIATELRDLLAPAELLVLGPGTTTRAIAALWGLDVPVLGVNVVAAPGPPAAAAPGLAATDVSGDELLKLVSTTPAHIAVTPIGGQGFLLGRGNQQLTPDVLRRVGLDRLHAVATEAKVAALGGRPFLVDTGDPDLDHEFPAYLRVITGYHRTTLYPLHNEGHRS